MWFKWEGPAGTDVTSSHPLKIALVYWKFVFSWAMATYVCVIVSISDVQTMPGFA